MLRMLKLSLVTLGLAAVVAIPSQVSATRATCEELADAQARGLSVEQIKREFNTTTARIAACNQSAQLKAALADRRLEAQARREARRGIEH